MPENKNEIEIADPVLPALRIHMHGLEKLRENSGKILAIGVLLLILGTIAIGMSVVTTLASMVFIGCLMIAGGLIESWLAFSVKEWGGFFMSLLLGILYVVAGVVFVANPGASAMMLTLMIAMFLVFGGIFRIVFALVERFPHWGWLALHGVINLALGVLIWKQWPASGFWVIGLFIGIDMIFNGWSLVMLGMLAKKMPERRDKKLEA